MAITLEKKQTISLEKTAGSTLRNVRLGLGWDAAKPSGFFGKLLGGAGDDLIYGNNGVDVLSGGLGNDTLVHLETVIGPLIVRAGREAADLPRDEVFATPDEKMLHLFKNGRRVSA